MIKSGKLWLIVRNYGLCSLYWGPHLRGQAPVFRVDCPLGSLLEADYALNPEEGDLMTISQNWDRQMSLPTDLS